MSMEKVLRHKAICDELNKLYEKKNHDYGDSFHQTFVEEGLAMTRIRLGDKFSRFKTLSRAIMTILEMDGEEASMLYAYGRPVEFVKEGTSLCGNENS